MKLLSLLSAVAVALPTQILSADSSSNVLHYQVSHRIFSPLNPSSQSSPFTKRVIVTFDGLTSAVLEAEVGSENDNSFPSSLLPSNVGPEDDLSSYLYQVQVVALNGGAPVVSSDRLCSLETKNPGAKDFLNGSLLSILRDGSLFPPQSN